jgi:hypothetical protein
MQTKTPPREEKKIMNHSEQARSSNHRTLSITLLAILTMIVLGGTKQAQAQWSQADASGNINNTNTSKVGIGTAAPSAKLEVQIGNAVGDGIKVTDIGAAGKYLYIGDGSSNTGVFAPYIFGLGGTAWGLILEGGVSSDSTNIPAVSVRGNIGYANLANSPIFTVAKSSGTELFRVGATGNVGIGLTNPAQKLDVAGDIAVNNLTVIKSNGVFAARSSYNSYTSDGVWNTQARPTTIFTPSPVIKTGFYFGYEDDAAGQYTPSLGISVAPNASANMRVLQLRQFGTTSDHLTPEAYNRFEMNVAGKLSWGSGTTGVDTSITRSGAGTLALSGGFNVTGNVGIGTTTPAGKLDVVGNVNITGTITSGSINAQYQDVAEWVPSRQKLAAGTVVVLDPEQSNHVMASVSAYDTRVAGVVSAQPGVILGVAGENKAMVATTGRVKVKVDATRSPIKVGDLLVTSAGQGVAMKSEPLDLGGTPIHRPGTLIGKALEPLEKGTGEILVLLSLQ